MRFPIASLLSTFGVGLALAATPPALLNYQGVLRDGANRPFDGSVPMVFRFFDAATAGQEILVDSHAGDLNLVRVSGGLFTVTLGGGDVRDGAAVLPNDPYLDLAAVFRDFGTVYLEIEVRGETLTPRVRVVSSAYALDADQVDGRHAAEFVDISSASQTKAGALRLQQTLTVDGTVTIAGGAPAPGRVLTSDGAGHATWQDPAGAPPGGLDSLAGTLSDPVSLPDLVPQPLPCPGTRATLLVGGAEQGAVVGFAGTERISRPFAFRVAVERESGLETAAMIGQVGRLLLRRPDRETAFSGVITRAQLAAFDGTTFTYVFVFEPGAAVLDRSVDYAVYQDMSVPDIVRALLRDAGVPFGESLLSSYPVVPMEVRYGERGLDFLGRAMEREGIHYTFREVDGRDQLYLADNNAAFLPTSRYYYYGHFTGPTDGREYVTSFRAGERQFTRETISKGYDFTRPTLDVTGVFDQGSGVGTQYEFRSALTSPTVARTYARLAADRETVRRVARDGTSNAPDLRAGRTFEIADRTPAGFSGLYVATSVEHLLVRDEVSGCLEYANRFEAVPNEVVYRPTLASPLPRVAGPITGRVAGPAGQTTYKDGYDRVKVFFHWDRTQAENERSSGWVRLLLPGDGLHSGRHYLPQIGDEVLITFLQGDPSQPVVTGTLFNASRMPPP